MAAPLGTPAPPTVVPVAQHADGVGQLTAVRAFTGRGRSTELKAPAHGVVVAMSPTGGAPLRLTGEPQAEADSASTTAAIDAATPVGREVITRSLARP
jgi:hypothetical protein